MRGPGECVVLTAVLIGVARRFLPRHRCSAFSVTVRISSAAHRKIREILSAADRKELIGTVEEIATKIRQYLGVTALTSVITGLVSALWAFAVGLELALVWGILNFLLNFVPVIGNIIGIIPASLYAIIQF